MNKINNIKEFTVTAIAVLLFFCMSILSYTSIEQLDGNARVINYASIVRGASQKIVKSELQGIPDDILIARLDSIIHELITGVGPHQLDALPDESYRQTLLEVENCWTELKHEIYNVRQGADHSYLYELSESYYILADEAVTLAEIYSTQQVRSSKNFLFGINVAFVVVLIVGATYYTRTRHIKNKAEMLGKIAYVDPLSQMPNRASCERKIDSLNATMPKEDIAVLMFDLNNLKRVNDLLGHQSGDRIIADFARIIKTEAIDYGFICRYGGDEFLAIFEDAGEDRIKNFLDCIHDKISSYNLLHTNELEKLSYAVGYTIGNLQANTIDKLIHEADKQMYIQKRQMKESTSEAF